MAPRPRAGGRGEGDRRRDERSRRRARRSRPRRVARARRGPRDGSPGPARRGGHVRGRLGHNGRGRVAGRGPGGPLSPHRGRRDTAVALSPALQLDAAGFSYGAVAALSAVSFAVAPGERVALLGRNGAGKSTLVRLVTGLLHPDEGTVRVGDWDTCDYAPEDLARRVGSVFQHADQQLFARTVREDVSFGPRALGYGEREVARRASDALEALALTAHAAQHPYDLPPALRTLAALAGALALEPAVLVLDEPTVGLDRALRAQVAGALHEHVARGAALLVVTHDLGFAAETLDRGIVLDRGHLAYDEPLATLLASAERLKPLGLVPPAVAALSVALELPGLPVREREAAHTLARVAGAQPRP
ncbi:MAG: hypothetical protein DMD31_09715 [Gemmatimonadetes bacterium]|nr:MAG: hypothetical protein DMD31_09715 [Gemmatimonadota bacterium]